MSSYKSPMHEMSCTTNSEFWNDSCSIPELTFALEHGAVGATTNPVIVGEVLKKELPSYVEQIKSLIKEMPKASEDEIAWKLNEQMAIAGAKLLLPQYEKSNHKNGYISIQTNTKYYNNEEEIIKQACHFNTLAPNIMVKMPVTKAGVIAIEECTYKGVTVNATVSFSVPQALAVAEAIERGLARREKEGLDTNMYPACTIMVGRIDDWLKAVASEKQLLLDPAALEMAGVACFKNAYKIYKEKNYKTRLLSAAYRNHHQWSDLIGGDVSMTIPSKWIKMFVNSDIKVENRMDNPVDAKFIEQLRKIPDFLKAHDADGMTVDEFDNLDQLEKLLCSF